MKPFASLIVLVVLLGQTTHSQTTATSALGLKPEQIVTSSTACNFSLPHPSHLNFAHISRRFFLGFLHK
jgi:hypothetical protein